MGKENIAVYDAATYVGNLNIGEIQSDSLMQLINVNIPGGESTVLYVDGMDYGIVIPSELAGPLYQALEDNK